MTVTAEDMRARLLTMEQVRRQFTATEPIQARTFSIGDSIRFAADGELNHGAQARDADETVPVWIDFGGQDSRSRLRLTRSTLDAVCATIGLPKAYVADCPSSLLIPHLNYWYREGLFGKSRKGKDFQFVVNEQDNALAFTKQGLTPFSNLTLLDQALDAIHSRCGNVEVLADYKFTHDLRKTILRLVIPDASQVLSGTGTPDDRWSLGIEMKNSLTGQSQTSFEGYLFRWVCTNGQIDVTANSGFWTRRKDSADDEVYAWARQAVDEVLGGLDGALDRVGALTQVGIEGSITDTLRDVFEHYRIALTLRPKIIRILEQYDGEITMYVIMNAITQVANEPGLEPSAVESLLRVGGDLPFTGDQRCGACHRMLHIH